jgi:hypothetical protein
LVSSFISFISFNYLNVLAFISVPILLELKAIVPFKLPSSFSTNCCGLFDHLFSQKATIGGTMPKNNLDISEDKLNKFVAFSMDNNSLNETTLSDEKGKKRKYAESFESDSEPLLIRRNANEILPKDSLSKFTSPDYIEFMQKIVAPEMGKTNLVYFVYIPSGAMNPKPYIRGQNLFDDVNLFEVIIENGKFNQYKFISKVRGGFVQPEFFSDLLLPSGIKFNPESTKHQGKVLSLLVNDKLEKTDIITHKDHPCCGPRLSELSKLCQKDLFKDGEIIQSPSEIIKRA